MHSAGFFLQGKNGIRKLNAKEIIKTKVGPIKFTCLQMALMFYQFLKLPSYPGLLVIFRKERLIVSRYPRVRSFPDEIWYLGYPLKVTG
jgi:hypothetical protein